LRIVLTCLAALAALCAATPAFGACGWPGYSYAGVTSTGAVTSVSATVTALQRPDVESGHVAAWVGVGGYGAGPGGADEWIQAGVAARAGGGQVLYVEWKRPGSRRRYVEVEAGVAVGERHRVAVVELRPTIWRAYVDGRAVGRAVRLPGSHGRFAAVATAESWDGGRPACNRFAYRFAALALGGTSGTTAELEDPGYRVVRSATAFVARSAR
jgi:hypothetical protein